MSPAQFPSKTNYNQFQNQLEYLQEEGEEHDTGHKSMTRAQDQDCAPIIRHLKRNIDWE